VVCILLTGMSGTGKSALVSELRDRGYTAYDADDDGFSEPRSHGGWGWRVEMVADLLHRPEQELLFFAGCSEEQALFDFDLKVLLTAPEPVIIQRVLTRRSNTYGRDVGEMEHILADLQQVEPLLRKTADLIVDTARPLTEVADLVLSRVSELPTDGTS
jgi:RNase adaptor protein for sRNA GlmZ degradation